MAFSVSAHWIDQVQVAYKWLDAHGIPVTRRDRDKYVNRKQSGGFKKAPHHDIMMEQAIHSVRAQRVRLGLPLVAQGGEDAESSYNNLNGAIGRILGVFQGMQYSNAGGGQSACFTAIEGFLIAQDNFVSILSKMWAPWYWSEAQMVIQDSIALNAGFYTECDVNKFLNNASYLATSEGFSELTARGSGAYMFQYKEYKKIKAGQGSSFVKGKSFGNLFATLMDYHI